MDVLFCCTGNQCRSPMAEALLRQRLDRMGIDASVRSRGLLPSGQPAPDQIRLAMGRRGIDLDGFRSTQLTKEDVEHASLLIGMERRHIREVVVHDPGALARSFTFRDLIARASAVGPRGSRSFDEWLLAVGEGRGVADLMGDGRRDEVPDPMGGPPEFFEAVAREVDDLVERLAWLVFDGPAPQSPAHELAVPAAPPRPGPRVFRRRGSASSIWKGPRA